MKKFSLWILLMPILLACNSRVSISELGLDAGIESKIDSIMAQMTIEEKIGQMSQFALDLIGKGGNAYYSDEPFEIDPAMLDTVIGKYKVGSILNTSNNRARTTEVWENSIRLIQERALQETGIPVIYGIDAIHGVTYTAGATFFPQEIGMAATFNREIVERGAQITAYETPQVIFHGISHQLWMLVAMHAGHDSGRVMVKTLTSMHKWVLQLYADIRAVTGTV